MWNIVHITSVNFGVRLERALPTSWLPSAAAQARTRSKPWALHCHAHLMVEGGDFAGFDADVAVGDVLARRAHSATWQRRDSSIGPCGQPCRDGSTRPSSSPTTVVRARRPLATRRGHRHLRCPPDGAAHLARAPRRAAADDHRRRRPVRGTSGAMGFDSVCPRGAGADRGGGGGTQTRRRPIECSRTFPAPNRGRWRWPCWRERRRSPATAQSRNVCTS